MRFSFAPFSPALLVVGAVCLVGGLCIFVRNLVKRDIQYESLCPWWVRLFIYSITLVFVPPMGLSTGLGLFVFGKNRELRRFAKGAVFVSLISLTFHMAIYLDQNSRQTDSRSQPRSWSSHDFPSITRRIEGIRNLGGWSDHTVQQLDPRLSPVVGWNDQTNARKSLIDSPAL